jgi:hypothetical protein
MKGRFAGCRKWHSIKFVSVRSQAKGEPPQFKELGGCHPQRVAHVFGLYFKRQQPWSLLSRLISQRGLENLQHSIDVPQIKFFRSELTAHPSEHLAVFGMTRIPDPFFLCEK